MVKDQHCPAGKAKGNRVSPPPFLNHLVLEQREHRFSRIQIDVLSESSLLGFWNSTIDDSAQRLIAYSANRRRLWKSKNDMRSIALMLCALSVLGAAEDFPLKRVPQLTYLVDYEASWSPDGRSIVLISSRHGGLKVHILDASSDGHGSDMRQITNGPHEDDSPAWSPDGRQIAFVSVHGDVSDIFVMKADGSNVRQVTRGLGQNIHPMWSPDGSRILFNTTYFAGQGQKDAKSSDEKRVIGEKRDDSIVSV